MAPSGKPFLSLYFQSRLGQYSLLCPPQTVSKPPTHDNCLRSLLSLLSLENWPHNLSTSWTPGHPECLASCIKKQTTKAPKTHAYTHTLEQAKRWKRMILQLTVHTSWSLQITGFSTYIMFWSPENRASHNKECFGQTGLFPKEVS